MHILSDFFDATVAACGGDPQMMPAITLACYDLALYAPLAERLDALLKQLNMPMELPALREEAVISAMFMDKKYSGQVLRVIVLNEIGKCFIHPTDVSFFGGMTAL